MDSPFVSSAASSPASFAPCHESAPSLTGEPDHSVKALPQEVCHRLESLALGFQSVCVVGLGYVGLPTALLFAINGLLVQGVDVSPHVLENIAQSRIGEVYPELADWWRTVEATENFRADARPAPADVFIITVPTPVHPVEKTCDLSMVRAATESILPALRKNSMVILESTVPPGTTRHLLKPLIEEWTGLSTDTDIFLCFSPERVLPGNTRHELIHNDRIVGGTTPEAALLCKVFLERVLKGTIRTTTDLTAEFCKLAENTYRDVNIALANELSILADETGVPMEEARALINMHPRVNLLTPGIGVGGHCIAVDPWFFVEASPINTRLIATSRQVNDRMPAYTAEKILRDVADLPHPRICLAGLAYKPDIADTRESPAMRVAEILRAQQEKPVDIRVYDPLLPEHQDVPLTEAVRDADYLAVLVRHSVLQQALSEQREAIVQSMRSARIRIF